MIRIIVALVVLFVAVLWMPLWLQGVFFIGALFWVRHRVFLLIPAVFADVVYAPSASFHLSVWKTTIVAATALVVFWYITTQTRVYDIYVSKIH